MVHPNLVEAVNIARSRGVCGIGGCGVGGGVSVSVNSGSSGSSGNNGISGSGNNIGSGGNSQINQNNSSQVSISASIITGIGVDDERHSQRQGYFAVYDGHCGAQAASHLQETLHLSIFNHPSYYTDIEKAIIESCEATDKAFLAKSREAKQYSGTTALGAIVRVTESGSELVVFNIGEQLLVSGCYFTF